MYILHSGSETRDGDRATARHAEQIIQDVTSIRSAHNVLLILANRLVAITSAAAPEDFASSHNHVAQPCKD